MAATLPSNNDSSAGTARHAGVTALPGAATISTAPPRIVGVSTTPASGGSVASGGTATITLKISESVSVSGGAPVLDLNDGGTAAYDPASSTSTALVFDYVVGSETTADLKVTGIENGGTVTDAHGNPLSLSRPLDLKLGVNAVSWKTGKSGVYSAGSNWSGGSAPTSSQEAALNVGGTYTVSVTADADVAALAIGNRSATLSLGSGVWFTASSGTGPDAIRGTVRVADGGWFNVGGTVNNSGTIILSGADSSTMLTIVGSVTLQGGGRVELASPSPHNSICPMPSMTDTFVNVDNTITGAGLIGGDIPMTFINEGVVKATNRAVKLQIFTAPNDVINSGTLEAATSATLELQNNVENFNTIAALGTKAKVLIDAAVTSSGVIFASGFGAQVELEGGSVWGGTLRTAAGGVIETLNGTNGSTGILSDVTLRPGAIVKTTANSELTLSNTITNSGGTLIATGSGSVIDGAATVSGGLVEATSGGTVLLSGGTIGAGTLVEAAKSGTVVVSGNVSNGGTLLAAARGGVVEVTDGGVVSGAAVVVGNGLVEMQSGGSADVSFRAGGSGGLLIEDSQSKPTAFGGHVSGFGGAAHGNHVEFIELSSVTFSAGQVSETYSGTSSGGVLTVSSGGNIVAEISFVGSYTSANFHLAAGSDGKVKITDPLAAEQHATLGYAGNWASGTLAGGHAAALLGNAIAATFVTAAGGHGGALTAEAALTAQPSLLTHPQA
jgi:hypothetical protein